MNKKHKTITETRSPRTYRITVECLEKISIIHYKYLI